MERSRAMFGHYMGLLGFPKTQGLVWEGGGAHNKDHSMIGLGLYCVPPNYLRKA